ncbi:hypothetical protein [Qipengyuania algicida]|nr:hypothetical protein [Qipengyuania algicida]
MNSTATVKLLAMIVPGLCLVACSNSSDPAAHSQAAPDSMAQMDHSAHAAQTLARNGGIPGTLAPFGEGYPESGDPCRRLGESSATSNWLDDDAVLVGCAKAEDAKPLGGKIVDTVQGVTILSIPMAEADIPHNSHDVLVPGTDFNATTTLKCGMDRAKPTESCPAGVKRNWGIDGTAMVVVTKPDGRKRALFFRDGKPLNADSSQADSSAGWTFTGIRKGDEVTIHFGPETYVVPDALVEGG